MKRHATKRQPANLSRINWKRNRPHYLNLGAVRYLLGNKNEFRNYREQLRAPNELMKRTEINSLEHHKKNYTIYE